MLAAARKKSGLGGQGLCLSWRRPLAFDYIQKQWSSQNQTEQTNLQVWCPRSPCSIEATARKNFPHGVAVQGASTSPGPCAARRGKIPIGRAWLRPPFWNLIAGNSFRMRYVLSFQARIRMETFLREEAILLETWVWARTHQLTKLKLYTSVLHRANSQKRNCEVASINLPATVGKQVDCIMILKVYTSLVKRSTAKNNPSE